MIPTVTIDRFIRSQERLYRERQGEIPSGELSDLLSSLALGVKIIGNLVSTMGFKGLYGYTDKENSSGDRVHEIDEESDHILVEILSSSGHFGLLLSEEHDTVVSTQEGHREAKYVVAFDPLDGSGNLGTNIPVGTIFCIMKKRERGRAPEAADFLQSGRQIVAAGYGLYGSKTTFVYSSGQGVHEFTLDPSIGEFILTGENIRSPRAGGTYGINEGNTWSWPAEVKQYIDAVKIEDREVGTPYSLRYSGSLIADFDRNMKRGGIYLYPPDKKYARGKLRLLYECFPLAFIAEQSGGDDAIRLAAEQMLRDFDESGDFLEDAALVELGLAGAQFNPGYEQGRRIGSYRIVSECFNSLRT